MNRRELFVSFLSPSIGTFCTESVKPRSSLTLWIHPSFASHSITSSARASNVLGTTHHRCVIRSACPRVPEMMVLSSNLTPSQSEHL
jgi:hypothetical protein